MREVHCYSNLEYVLKFNPALKERVDEIREQKVLGLRLKPSASLIDKSQLLTNDARKALLDKIAFFVDENVTGRSDMCQQFAELLCLSLVKLRFVPKMMIGTVEYYDESGKQLFRWNPNGHFWVQVKGDLIDGNLDSLFENPTVPKTLHVSPYWGPITEVPRDRKYFKNLSATVPARDSDVQNIWWPDLSDWLDGEFLTSFREFG
ncbi:hypothetical protein KBF38_22720 [bacterium]|nr:hypothetical protein [bacterium]